MANQLLSYYESAAHAAALCSVASVPVLPAPLAAECLDALKKIHPCDYADVESQSGQLAYAMAATIAEKRSFLASSNMHALDEVQKASFMRMPLVAANFSRAVGTFTTRTDLTGVFALRDAGWLMFLAESPQEALDSVVMAYRICEDSKVLLPAVVNIDGIANMREVVNVPNKKIIDNLLPSLRMPRKLRDNGTFGSPVFEGYQEFREQQQLAMLNAKRMIRGVGEKWYEKFRRSYGSVERFHSDDADYVLVTAGFYSSAAKSFVLKARQQGERVGLLRMRVARPWPSEDVADALKNAKKIAVIDRGVSLGASGFLHNELKSVHNFCSSFVSYNALDEKSFADVLAKLKKQEKPETVWF
ncbi:MAG: hypothetical protein HY368_02630 [Candidatus Aenigmarchaeota archaeon]|nr:hypothetical protein [Candidatus Aenigmarchaeota archaeon]